MLNEYALVLDDYKGFLPLPTGSKQAAENLAEDYTGFNHKAKVLTRNAVKLEDLPEDVQKDVKGTLSVYDECSVWYENGRWHTMAACGIKASYNWDEFYCGTYYNK